MSNLSPFEIRLDLLKMAKDLAVERNTIKDERKKLAIEQDSFNKIVAEDLVLDKSRQTLFKDKEEILLTRKEYSLIDYLMSNQNYELIVKVFLQTVDNRTCKFLI